jgi:hypothetical protein
MLQPYEADRTVSNKSQDAHPRARQNENETRSFDALERLPAYAHASTLAPASDPLTSRAFHSFLRLQRDYGNRYVRRVVDRANRKGPAKAGMQLCYGRTQSVESLPLREHGSATIQRDDDDADQQKAPPLVGQDRAVDPKDNICSLKWTLGGPKWILPSGVSCDPGMFHIPSHDDPLKYPSHQPSAPEALGPVTCPGGQPSTPVGTCCPENQTWDGQKCSAPAPPPVHAPCPPDQTGDGTKCATANWASCLHGEAFDASGKPCPISKPQEQPGDYNVPDESQVATV